MQRSGVRGMSGNRALPIRTEHFHIMTLACSSRFLHPLLQAKVCTRFSGSCRQLPSINPGPLQTRHIGQSTSAAAMVHDQGQGKVFVLVVTGKLKPGRADEFKQLFKPLADHVTAKEPGCLTYQLSMGVDDPDAVCIFERYVSREYLEDVHWQSAPFKEFAAKAREADMWESKSAAKYWEEAAGAYGFTSR